MHRIALTLALMTLLVGAQSSLGKDTGSDTPVRPEIATHDCENLCGPLTTDSQLDCVRGESYLDYVIVGNRYWRACFPLGGCPSGMSTEAPVCPEGEQVYSWNSTCYFCAQPCVGPFFHEFLYDGDGRDGEGSGALATAAPIVHLESGTPNPFRWETRIAYSLAGGESVRLTVHDVTGRMVAELPVGVRAGRH